MAQHQAKTANADAAKGKSAARQDNLFDASKINQDKAFAGANDKAVPNWAVMQSKMLTPHSLSSSVQFSTNTQPNLSAHNIQQIAASGISGAAQPLPYLNQIQKSFGSYDITSIRAHVGAKATTANRAINSEAYATGNRVAFLNSNPSLHTVAHEAAHVVQQQQGVKLKSGISAIGDKYEQQADSVADAVIRGKSAETLLKQDKYSASLLGTKGQSFKNKTASINPIQLQTVQKPTTVSSNMLTEIDVNTVSAKEMIPTGNTYNTQSRLKTTELSALLMPSDAPQKGSPTTKNVNPMGWEWIKKTEKLPSTSKPGTSKIKYWVRFHLLNAKIGGDGTNYLHLTPTRKTTNSQWESDIESDMKKTILGDGNIRGVPVYYKVNLEYWKSSDAPPSYDTRLPGGGGVDYRPNIKLFPKQIKAEWYSYRNQAWQQEPDAETAVILPKPASLGGSKQLELVRPSSSSSSSSSRSLVTVDQIADDISIPKQVVEYLRDYYASKTAPTKYSEVRKALDVWLLDAPSSHAFEQRSLDIVEADARLRSALAGMGTAAGANVLTIKGQHLQDDGPMKPWRLKGPHSSDYISEATLKSYTDNFTGGEGAIRGGYQAALNKSIEDESSPSPMPPVSKVIREIFLYDKNETFSNLQITWREFLKANKKLPAMKNDIFKDNNFAKKSEEMIQIFYEMTQDLLQQGLESVKMFEPEPLQTYANEVLSDFKNNYLDFLKKGKINVFIAEINDSIEKKSEHLLLRAFWSVVNPDDSIQHSNLREFFLRMKYIKDVQQELKKLIVEPLFNGLDGRPENISLNLSIAKKMQDNFEEMKAEKKREDEEAEKEAKLQREREKEELLEKQRAIAEQQRIIAEQQKEARIAKGFLEADIDWKQHEGNASKSKENGNARDQHDDNSRKRKSKERSRHNPESSVKSDMLRRREKRKGKEKEPATHNEEKKLRKENERQQQIKRQRKEESQQRKDKDKQNQSSQIEEIRKQQRSQHDSPYRTLRKNINIIWRSYGEDIRREKPEFFRKFYNTVDKYLNHTYKEIEMRVNRGNYDWYYQSLSNYIKQEAEEILNPH